MKVSLTAHPPFSLRSVLRSHGWIQLAPFREDDATGGFSYIAHLESGKVIDLHVQASSSGINVEIMDDLTTAEVHAVQETVSWMLNLDQDFSTFYELAGQEPKLAQAAVRAQGRILRSPTLKEATFTILFARINPILTFFCVT